MFVLLKQLALIRHGAGLPRGERPLSYSLRHVDAGSCNGCEHELGLVTSPLHDLQRFGLGIVASPRHADVLLVTGPVINSTSAWRGEATSVRPKRARS